MRRLIVILFLFNVCYAQFPPGYTGINTKYSWVGGIFSSGLHPPQYSGFPVNRTGVWVADGAIAVDTVGNKFYVRFNGVWRALADSSGVSDASGYTFDRTLYYPITFKPTTFVDSTLTNELVNIRARFDKGLILKDTGSATLAASFMKANNYGFLINENWAQRLVFQVLDSSTTLSIGIGIEGDGALNAGDNINYITATIADSASSTLNNYQEFSPSTISSTGVLINYKDFIELTVTRTIDSVIFFYRNITNNNSVRLVRNAISTNSATSVRMGMPTIFFNDGHVRIIDYSILNQDYDYVFIGNSITHGFNSSTFDTSFVSRLKGKTASKINNTALSSAVSSDYLNGKYNLNFRNKVVFLSGLMGNDLAAGYTNAQSKGYYEALVSKLKANGNTVVHLSATYRTTFMGSGTWAEISSLNRWLDTAYAAIDKVIQIDTTTAAMLSDGVHLNDAGHTNVYNSIYRDAAEYFERGRIISPLGQEKVVFTSTDRLMKTDHKFRYKTDTLSDGKLFAPTLWLNNPTSNQSGILRVNGNEPTFVTPIVVIRAEGSSGTEKGMITALAANITTNTRLNLIYGGKNTSTNNIGLFTYEHVADGDSTNNIEIALVANPVIKFYGNRSARMIYGPFELPDIATPKTPSSGYGRIYVRSDSLRFYNDNSVEFTLGTTSGSTTTPTGTIVSNVDAVTPFALHYTRVGTTVTFSGTVDVDISLAVGSWVVELSLPPGLASNFTSTTDAAGVIVPANVGVFGGYITASVANDRLVLTGSAVGTGTVTYPFTGSFTLK